MMLIELNELLAKYGGFIEIIGILVGIFIAYHIYYLSKSIDYKQKLKHKEEIRKKANKILGRIRNENVNSEVYLINIDRYYKDYPQNEEKRGAYSHLKAEIKTTNFRGVEFFSISPISLYRKNNGNLTKKEIQNSEVLNAFPVSTVPYSWIEDIDPTGDEFNGCPLFFVKYKGRSFWGFWKRFGLYKHPYSKTDYYELNPNYKKTQPSFMKYRLIEEKIY